MGFFLTLLSVTFLLENPPRKVFPAREPVPLGGTVQDFARTVIVRSSTFGRVVFVLAFVALAVGFLVPRGAGAARLFTSGFETDNFTETEWSAVSGATLVTTPVRSGTYAVKAFGNDNAYKQLPSAKTSGTLFYRWTVLVQALPSATGWMISVRNIGSLEAFALRLTPTGIVEVWDDIGSTVRISSATQLATDTWYTLEVRHLISDTVGEYELRIDGTNEGSASGFDTLPGAGVGRITAGTPSFGTSFSYFDDIAINDDTGSFQNSWAGPGKIALIKPDSDVTVTWTRTPANCNDASLNYQCVDEVPGTPNDATDYNVASTITGRLERLGLTDLPAEVPSNATIIAVDVYARVGSNGTSSRRMQLELWNESGGQTGGPIFDVNINGWKILATSDHLVFDASGKTKANINSFNAGYEPRTDSEARERRVTALWVNVEWLESAAPSPGGPQVSSRSDILSDSRLGAGSNHTISFVIHSAIDAGEDLDITWPTEFAFPGGLDCGDVDVATGTQFTLSATSTSCAAGADTWGAVFTAASRRLRITAPSNTGTYVATGTEITITAGLNASFQQNGTTQITNPSTGGIYTVSVGGVVGAGNMLVSLQSGLVVEAVVREHLTLAITGVPNWYNTSWGFRKRIIVDSTSVSGTQGHVDFPMLFNSTRPDFRHTDNGGNVGSVTGWDFVFTAADGTTKLDHEIEKYASTTGELVAWTRIPFLSTTSTNELFVYYGYAAASDQQNATGVWDSNFAGVWHLDETTGTENFDSTVNSNTGTKVSATEPNPTGSGQIDGAQDFDGINDRITTAAMSIGNTNFTVSGWVNGSVDEDRDIVAQPNGSGDRWNVRRGSDNTFSFYTNEIGWIGGNIVVAGWAFFAIVKDDSGTDIYTNGLFGNGGPGGYDVSSNNIELYIGRFPGNTFFKGTIDEIRISTSVRSSSWILTEYNNQYSPNTFYTLGDEEAQAQTSCTADDGASVTVVNTTGVSVPFGTVAANTFYIGCQDVEVSTNAAGGYVLTVQEDGPMRTGGGVTIPDTNCDSGCDEITAGAWTNAANNGFGHTCRNQVNNDCNAEYANGTGFRRFPSVSGGTAGLSVKVTTGSYTGDGSATSISHGLGTTPKVVMVWHDQNSVTHGWVLRTNQYSGSTSINFPTGSNNSRLASDMITGFGSTTFSLGTASSVNATSSSYQWIAYAGTGVATGAYDGNGADNRDIPHGLGTTPKMLFVWPDADNNTDGICARTDQYTGDISYCWQVGTLETLRTANIVQAMDGTNFQVGTDSHANSNSVAYKWFALAGPSVATGSYTGDGNDDRDISHSLSATPSGLLVWRDQSAIQQGLSLRSNQYTGDVSMTFDLGPGPSNRIANLIQAMTATSFQVGTQPQVNNPSTPHQWVAVKSSSVQSEKAGETLMASSTRVSIAVGRVKFRLSVPASQGAGTYTNVITYIVTPTF